MHQENAHGSALAVTADDEFPDFGPDSDGGGEAERSWLKTFGTLMHWALPILALTLVGIVGWREIRHLDIAEIHRSFQAISLGVTVALLLAGLATASLNSLYDLLLRRWLTLEIGVKDLIRTAWVASALNNVVGFSGMTGSGVRVSTFPRFARAGSRAPRSLRCGTEQ